MGGIKRMNTYSKEHLLYLKKLKQKTVFINAVRVAVLVVLLTVWELAAALKWVNPFITSSPSRILSPIIC